jgi:hypothetical protein
VNLKDQSRPGDEGGSEKTIATVTTIISASDIADAYCVVVVSYGHPRRRLFLSLHSATQAVKRAQKRGQPAELILCKLELITASLNVDGEVAE